MDTQQPPSGSSVLDLATILRDRLETTLRRLGYTPSEKALTISRLSLEGRWGYASPVCKSIARGPEGAQQVAEQVVAAFPAHPLVQRVEALRGFVNFYVAIPAYANGLVDDVRARGAVWGHGTPKHEQVMVEFAQMNTHKAVHVGHLRNIVLGDAVVRIMRAAGWSVLAATYPGDIGMHVIKCLWCYRTFYVGHEPATGRGRWLGALYAEADTRLEYRKYVTRLLGEALSDPDLGPQLTGWLRAHGESASAATADVQRLLALVAATRLDSNADTPHESDEDLAPDLDLSSIDPATIAALWHALGELLPAGSPLREEYTRLSGHFEWWPQVPAWRDAVRALFAQWEAKDPALLDLWQRTRQWSLDEFAEIFRTLDVQIDVEFFESQVEEEGRQIVEQLVHMGIAEDLRSRGEPVLVRIDEQLRRHPVLREKYADKLFKKNKDGSLAEREPYRVLIVLRSDGTTLYATKDLALARRKFEDYHVERSIYVIDVRQSLYFQQVFRVLELYGFTQADKCEHLGYEIVGTKEGAFSSRKGNMPLYEDFERDALQHARAEIDKVAAENLERRPEGERPRLSDAEKDAVARTIALGAIKYTMLDKDNNTVIVFDWEQVLNPRQQSAPYIMYAHARASSVLARAEADPTPVGGALDFTRLQLDGADVSLLERLKEVDDRDPDKRRVISLNSELTLLDLLSRYPDEVLRAATLHNPVTLTRYLFQLAEAFNKFWDTTRILNAETAALRRSRLALTAAVRQTIANGLGLLGIAAPDSM
ncbi:MAG TPA: arginine--tRNA ligase [Chloroflexia bacterium]|nr:arginine--tRNA ligase [Chloroflexia bacterium]